MPGSSLHATAFLQMALGTLRLSFTSYLCRHLLLFTTNNMQQCMLNLAGPAGTCLPGHSCKLRALLSWQRRTQEPATESSNATCGKHSWAASRSCF